MLILSAADVERLLPISAAIPLMAEAFTLVSSGQGAFPIRTHLKLLQPPGDALAMPAYDGARALGVKLVTVLPENHGQHLPTVRAVYLLLRASDGEPLLLCDGATLTGIRTAAASGAALQALANPGGRRAAVIGAGTQARTHLLMLDAVRDLQSVAVYARTRAQLLAFCEQMQPHIRARLEPSLSADEAVQGADLVVAATSSATPVFNGESVKPGTHVTAVGAYRSDMRELDATLVKKARVYVDAREAALHEAGDLVMPLEAGEISSDHLRGEVGEVLLGRVAGRHDEQEITLFKSVGMAAQDLLAAGELYRRATEAGCGIQARL